MARSRILFVSTQMEAGGVQVRSIEMLRSLRAEGFDAQQVFLYRKRGTFDGEPGVTCLHSKAPAGPLDLLKIFYRLIVHAVRFRPFAVVGFAHYASPLSALAGVIAGAQRRVATQTNPPKSHGRVARILDFGCGMLGVYTSNVAASKSIARCFSGYPSIYKANIRTVYNGVRAKESGLSKAEARRAFGLSEHGPWLVAAGRLSRQKNHDFLLKILTLIPDCKLAIVGEGELRSELEQTIISRKLNGRVALLGEIPPARIADFLKAGDLFVFPSVYEAFGLAVVEAMLAGLPVVASDCPALVEVVGDGGVLLPLDDAAEWARVITEILADPLAHKGACERSLERGSMFSFGSMYSGFKEAML